MAINFNNIGHFFAKAFKAIVTDLPKLEATKPVVEGVTAAVGQSAFVPIEDAAYAVLGAVAAALNSGGEAAVAKLQDAGLDVTAVQKVQAVLTQSAQLAAVAKAL